MLLFDNSGFFLLGRFAPPLALSRSLDTLVAIALDIIRQMLAQFFAIRPRGFQVGLLFLLLPFDFHRTQRLMPPSTTMLNEPENPAIDVCLKVMLDQWPVVSATVLPQIFFNHLTVLLTQSRPPTRTSSAG